MSDTVDARGLVCPKPLIETRKLLSKTSSDRVEVLVDRQTPANNISKMAADLGWSVETEKTDVGDIRIILGRR